MNYQTVARLERLAMKEVLTTSSGALARMIILPHITGGSSVVIIRATTMRALHSLVMIIRATTMLGVARPRYATTILGVVSS